ncbi:MAG: magnesium/cobalt transporter CorA [Armatimonadetes bacterium]|nr:magnesium/cobalt transporter CorA [Armatimonadota bacterium]
MITVHLCTGKRVSCDLPPDQIKSTLESHGAADPTDKNGMTLWVDVSAPTPDDWATIAAQFDFHELAIEDAQAEQQRPKVDTYEGYLFLSVRAWAGKPETVTSDVADVTSEIDMFLGTNYLVTIHAGDVSALDESRKRWTRNPAYVSTKPAYLLYTILDTVVDDYFPVMDALDTAIDDIETTIYADASPDPRTGMTPMPDIKPALALKKRLLLLRQTVAPHRDVLNNLLRIDNTALMPRKLGVFYQDVYDHTLRLTEQIDLHRDILGGVMDSMMAQSSNRIAETSNRLNQVMKTIAAISTILMSAALVTGVYGMNFDFMPELHWTYGYPFALGMMVLIATGLAVYFRRIQWF